MTKSRHAWFVATAIAGTAGCSADTDAGTSWAEATSAEPGTTEGAASDGDDADDDAAPATTGSNSPADSSSGASASDDGESGDSADGGDGGSHGSGMCGGGFGNADGLGHIPPCPNDAVTFHARYLATRADYYHDGEHPFEPEVVAWDEGLAALAQEYAEAYAAGIPPDGEMFYTKLSPYDPYWDGTFAGHRAIAGAETPTSCDCSEPDFFGGSEAPAFYNNSSAYFRAGIVRMDGVVRMGIGHVAPGDGTHYWTLLFSPD